MENNKKSSEQTKNEPVADKMSRRAWLKHARNFLFGAALMTKDLGLDKIQLDAQTQNLSPANETKEKVGDLISREELLNKYHVKIFDLPPSKHPSDYVELNFRQGAKESKLFKKLAQGNLKLDVFVLDDFHIDDQTLEPQQKSALPKHILESMQRDVESTMQSNREQLEKTRPTKKAEYTQKFAKLEEQQKTGQISTDKYQAELAALNYTYGMFLRDQPTREDLLVGYQTLGLTKTDVGEKGPDGKVTPHAYVFLSARNLPPTKTFKVGNESSTVDSVYVTYMHNPIDNTAPNPEQSYPDPKSITLNPDNEAYAIKSGYTSGIVARHEFNHASGVIVERDADMKAIQEITKAHQTYIESGDTSQYWLVFNTPQGQMVTQNINETNPTV
jgi:hypothetical protein